MFFINTLFLNQNNISIFSKRLFLSLLLIIFLNSKNIYIYSTITLPFTFINKKTNTSAPVTTTPKDYFESFLKNPIYTTLKINNKPIKFHLTLDRHTTYISQKTLSEIDPVAAEIKEDEDLYSLEYIGIYRAKYTKSSFDFISNNNNISLNNYTFFMVKKMCEEFDYTIKTKYLATEDEEIGFNVLKGNKMEKVTVEEEDEDDPYYLYNNENIELYDSQKEGKLGEKWVNKNNGYLIEENTNIITQLEKQKFISSYTFSIIYDNKNEEKGKIIIGGMPHEYDPKHFSEKYFIYHTATLGEGYGNWGLNLNDIKYDGVSLPYIKSAEITIDFGFILSTPTYKDYLDNKFFNDPDYAEFCKEEKVDDYLVKYCDEKVIKNFKKISFVLSNQYNAYNQSNVLEFDYNDLFIKAPGDNKLYYFQIVFPSNTYFKWKLGRPVFKKYPAVFDQEKKIFGFYTQTGEYDITDDGKASDNGSRLSFSWILVIILSIILIGLAIAFFNVLPYIKRKKKANELDDEYDYPTGNIPENEPKNEKKDLLINS